jgi:hypothetical protein
MINRDYYFTVLLTSLSLQLKLNVLCARHKMKFQPFYLNIVQEVSYSLSDFFEGTVWE